MMLFLNIFSLFIYSLVYFLLINHKNHVNLLLIMFFLFLSYGLHMMESNNFCYLLLIIVFLGGIMVLMMYTVMMTSNLTFSFSSNLIMPALLTYLTIEYGFTPNTSFIMMFIPLSLELLLMLVMFLFVIMVGSFNMLKSNKSLNVYSQIK